MSFITEAHICTWILVWKKRKFIERCNLISPHQDDRTIYWLKHTKENISYCCIDRSSLRLLWTARCLCYMNLMIDLVLECHDLKKSLLSVLAFVRFLVHYSRTQLEKLGTHLRKTFSSWWIIVYLAKPWKTSESV